MYIAVCLTAIRKQRQTIYITHVRNIEKMKKKTKLIIELKLFEIEMIQTMKLV